MLMYSKEPDPEFLAELFDALDALEASSRELRKQKRAMFPAIKSRQKAIDRIRAIWRSMRGARSAPPRPILDAIDEKAAAAPAADAAFETTPDGGEPRGAAGLAAASREAARRRADRRPAARKVRGSGAEAIAELDAARQQLAGDASAIDDATASRLLARALDRGDMAAAQLDLLRRHGATHQDIALALRHVIWPTGSRVQQTAEYAIRGGGDGPAFWVGRHDAGPPTLAGGALCEAIRYVAHIPAPGERPDGPAIDAETARLARRPADAIEADAVERFGADGKGGVNPGEEIRHRKKGKRP